MLMVQHDRAKFSMAVLDVKLSMVVLCMQELYMGVFLHTIDRQLLSFF